MVSLADSRHQRNKRPHYHPLNPAKSGGGTQKKETNNKLRSEAPMFKLINQSLLFCWRFHEKRLAPQNITLDVIHRCDTTLHI
ncbi:hypothetical protein IGI04_042299 [Brassica rapa subsp. trilocularis]|uniref:Uncharacterized protein n=1 Tax=Brassica rapa subsp. trilocularis TaxID=1813537 RepID=A0ABQ7KKB5_BRACM|nr:hypothetical protein IGI04_042299 [Brassica rapa subsp. trilocularis]